VTRNLFDSFFCVDCCLAHFNLHYVIDIESTIKRCRTSQTLHEDTSTRDERPAETTLCNEQ